MGLFSGKKKTYVNTSISRMVEDEDIIPSHKMAVLDYTMSQNSASTRLSSESLSDYLIRSGTNNVPARARKALKYSSKPDYAYGQMKANLITSVGVNIRDVVEDELDRIYPEGVAVTDAYFGPMNNFYFLKPILNRKYGYDYDTNELVEESRKIGFPCYMESAVIRYSHYTMEALIDPDTQKQVGLSAEAGYTPFRAFNPKAPQVPWDSNYQGDHDIAEITVVYKDAAGLKQTYKFSIDYLEFEPSSKPEEDGLDESDTDNINPDAVAPEATKTLEDQDYFQANYSYVENGVTKTDTFIYLYGSGLNTRLDNLFIDGDAYGKYLPHMYARLGGRKCNLDSLKDTPAYKSQVGLANMLGFNWSEWVNEIHKSVGSLDSVTQIYMKFALPANTQDPLIQEYMYEYFLGLYDRIPKERALSSFSDLHKDMISWGAKRGQNVTISDNTHHTTLNFSSIGYMDVRGSIGEVGTVASGTFTNQVQTGNKVTTALMRSVSRIHCHYYRKQLTTDIYREVRVYALNTTEYVGRGKSTKSADTDENLLIPLDMAVDSELNGRQREALYTKAMYIVLSTLKVVKQKWYQTGIFKAIMFVVTVVVTYLFPPAGAAMYGWMAVMYAVAQAIVISLVIQVAVKLLVRLGVDVGFAAAVVAIIALFYGGYTALTKTTGVAGVTTVQLMQISSQAFSASSMGFQLQTQRAIADFNSLMTDLTEEQKEIQRKAKELGMGQHGSLLMFEPPIDIGVRMGESPDDYYDRSIRITNLASTIYSLPEQSVDLALALPTTQAVLTNMQEQLNELSILRV